MGTGKRLKSYFPLELCVFSWVFKHLSLIDVVFRRQRSPGTVLAAEVSNSHSRHTSYPARITLVTAYLYWAS